MGRRSSPSRGSSAFGRGRSPSPSTRSRAAPAPPPPKAVAPQPASQVGPAQPTMASPGGGLMANVASTAAGVAIGHTIGHAITGAFSGGSSQGEQPVAVDQQQQQQQPQAAYQPQHSMANQADPCRFEMEQFLSCAQSQSNDLSLCDGFNQVLRECKVKYSGNNLYQ